MQPVVSVLSTFSLDECHLPFFEATSWTIKGSFINLFKGLYTSSFFLNDNKLGGRCGIQFSPNATLQFYTVCLRRPCAVEMGLVD